MSYTRIDDGERAPMDAARSAGPPTPLQRVAGAIGNRAFAGALAWMRDGEGILPGGVVHPDVQAAIHASRGRGHLLNAAVRRRLEDGLGESLRDVRVHTDEHAATLARAVSARAFTVGSDIFFSHGEYGDAALVAHEVTHVLQQRGAPSSGPLSVSQPGDPSEVEAEAVARELTP